jgi:hypothetical protein
MLLCRRWSRVSRCLASAPAPQCSLRRARHPKVRSVLFWCRLLLGCRASEQLLWVRPGRGGIGACERDGAVGMGLRARAARFGGGVGIFSRISWLAARSSLRRLRQRRSQRSNPPRQVCATQRKLLKCAGLGETRATKPKIGPSNWNKDKR